MIKIGTRSYSQAPVDTRGVNGYGLPQLAETSLRACCFYGPPNSPGTFRAVTGKPDHYRFPADCLKSLLFPHNSENQTPLDPAELIKSLLAQNQQAGAKGLHISFVHMFTAEIPMTAKSTFSFAIFATYVPGCVLQPKIPHAPITFYCTERRENCSTGSGITRRGADWLC